MNKGFTLIEMIVTMTIFVIIALIAFPIINGMVQKGNNDKYNLFLNDVFLATEAYIQKYSDNYPNLSNNNYVFVYMDELVQEGLVKSTLVNPNYCNNTRCFPKQISTCENGNCTIDNYTIIVGKNSDGVLYYLLIDKLINKVCLKDDQNCEADNNTVIVELNDNGSFKIAEEA